MKNLPQDPYFWICVYCVLVSSALAPIGTYLYFKQEKLKKQLKNASPKRGG